MKNKYNNDDIFISIICCCYNSEKYLLNTLLSIKNQTYKKYEIIIVNDGSIDKTIEIINQFIKDYSEIKIKLINQKNKGLSFSRNEAIKYSSFDWISIIDHDDIWVKKKLEIQVNQILHSNHCSLFFSDFQIFDNSNIKKTRFYIAKTKDKYEPAKLNMKKNHAYMNLALKGCFIGSSTVIFNKKIINKLDGFNEDYIFLTDYIFFLKVAENYNIYCSDKVLSKWRYHNDNATIKMNTVYVKEMNLLYINLIKGSKLNLLQKFKIFKLFLKLNLKNIVL